MIRQTIFSIAVNENNRLMTGELFEIKDNCLKIVSLDGHRISIRKMPLKKEYSDRKIVVPGKTLSEISKILSRIFGFALDLRSDVVSKDRSTRFIDLIGRYDYAHLEIGRASCRERV